jgi:hypothetical protein
LQGLILGLRIDYRFMIDLRMIKILLLTIAVLEGIFPRYVAMGWPQDPITVLLVLISRAYMNIAVFNP